MDLATIQIKVDTREVNAANDDIHRLGNTGRQTEQQINQQNTRLGNSYDGLKRNIQLVGGAIAALGVAALARSFFDTVVSVEQMRGSLVTATGSIESANVQFDKLLGFASTTPFTLDQSVEGFIKLKNLGLDPSERAMTSYGNTAAAMGKDLNQMIEAVADASTMEFERLKEFGIKAKQEADSVTFTFQGVSTKVGKNSKEIQEYLLGIGEINFGGAMEDQMRRLPGMLSNLKDNVTRLFLAIAASGALQGLAVGISAATTAVSFLTDNVDSLVLVFQMAAAAALVAFGPGAMLGAIAGVRTAVIGLYGVITAHPFAAIAAAMAAAAIYMVRNWDDIKATARSAAIQIEIGWNNLLHFLMAVFSPALSAITGLFSDVQDQAIATWTAIKAAAADPLDAIDTFNTTFDQTIAGLRAGRSENAVFADSMDRTQSRVTELTAELDTLRLTTLEEADATQAANDTLLEFPDISTGAADGADALASSLAETAKETRKLQTQTAELMADLLHEREQIGMTGLELEIYNNLKKAGVDANSELGQSIVGLTTQVYNEQQAYKDAQTAAEELEKAAKKAAEEKAEAYREMHEDVSGFFVDLFNNGADAFDNLIDSWKNMLLKMVADWIASGIMNLFGNLQSSGTGVLSALASGFSGLFSSITSGIGSAGGGGVMGAIAGAASGAASAVGQFVGGLTGTAVGTSAAAAVGPPTAAAAAGAGVAGSLGMGGTAATAATTGTAATAGTAATSTTAATTGAASGVGNFLSTVGPAAVFAYLAYKWDIFGLNRVNYPAFDDLPVEQQLREIESGLYRTLEAQPGWNYTREDTEGMAAFEPAIVLDWYDRIRRRYGASGASTLDALEAWARGKPEFDESMASLVDGSHRDGLGMVPYDGYVAELHAGERVLTAEQARSSDDMASLKQSMEEIMIAVARSTQRLYRINDRWDKDGLPPTRA